MDIPSGVSTDESRILGVAAQCHYTITFQAGKPGCYQYPGAKYCGNVIIRDISVPQYWPDDALGDHKESGTSENKPSPSTFLLTPAFISDLVPERAKDSHKGTFGHLLTVCGSAGMGVQQILHVWQHLKTEQV